MSHRRLGLSLTVYIQLLDITKKPMGMGGGGKAGGRTILDGRTVARKNEDRKIYNRQNVWFRERGRGGGKDDGEERQKGVGIGVYKVTLSSLLDFR